MPTKLGAAGLAVIVLVGGCSTTTTGSPVAGAGAQAEQARCAYTPTPQDPAPPGKDVGLPPERQDAQAGSVRLVTSSGSIKITLVAGSAPCTVRNFVFLAGKRFYDGTLCHRLTASADLKVLQCGDPKGDGSGGPGYTIPDENPTTLPPSPTDPGLSVYGRGAVAMATAAAPDSGGSQFFLVYGDSTVQPKYAVFGTVDEAGLATLDKIAAGGIEAAQSPEDGAPKTPVRIQDTVVGG